MKKTDLVEIKKNNIGTGLLIEQDGYASLPKSAIKEHMSSEDWHVPYPFVVDAVFQKYGVKNANGRIYPKEVLMSQVEKYQDLIRQHLALGECNHPDSSTIDLGRISHNIIELHWEGCTLVGKLELNLSQGFVKYGICSTLGDTAANLLLNGYKIGVSSRGVGSVEQKMGQYIVGTDFDLICWDLVSSPSTPNAYIGTREELEQYIESENKSGDVIKESSNEIRNKISKIRNILNS